MHTSCIVPQLPPSATKALRALARRLSALSKLLSLRFLGNRTWLRVTHESNLRQLCSASWTWP